MTRVLGIVIGLFVVYGLCLFTRRGYSWRGLFTDDPHA